MHAPGLWFIDENHLSAVLREWAAYYRHADVSQPAEDARFAGCVDFLYSRQVRHSGMFICSPGGGAE